jgi:hypothetical protein
MATAQKFEPQKARRNTSDDTGTVRVSVVLFTPTEKGHRPKKGNIVRSFSVKNAEVSAVAETISKALFG